MYNLAFFVQKDGQLIFVPVKNPYSSCVTVHDTDTVCHTSKAK